MFKIFLLVCISVSSLVDSIPLDKSVIEEYIVGGNDTDISKVPHQVAVFQFNCFVCGGFIVSPTHIVTAGHCIYMATVSEVTIRAGSSFFGKGGVTVKTKKLYVHPKYHDESKDYDVGIIELATPLKIDNKTMKPIKLGTKEPSIGSVVLASGWGFVNEDTDEEEMLQSATIPVYNRTKCETEYKTHNRTITPRMFCAGIEGRRALHGDQGGALVYNGGAVGIVSFTNADFPRDMPGVHTNIAHPEITKFIKDITKV